MDFTVYMWIGYAVIAGAIAIISYRMNKKDDEEYFQKKDLERKKELKNLVENREVKTNLNEYDEEKFWKLIDDIYSRCKDNHFNHLGLLKDSMNKLTAEELIEIDNLLYRLYKENLSYDVTAAAHMIFKNGDIPHSFLLMSLFLMRGQVFFGQACNNPDFFIGKPVDGIDGRTPFDVISDLYYTKTGKLFPLDEDSDKEIKIDGEPWKEGDLPSRYPKLWMEYM